MATSVLNAAVGIGDNNTNPVVPFAGTGGRVWLQFVTEEGGAFGTAFPSTAAVAGDTNTTFNLLASVSDPATTMSSALYYCLDADIGINPSTLNGSLTYNADGNTPNSSTTVVVSIVLDGASQTSPFTNVEDDGWSVDSTNSTENCPFTLDELVDAVGVGFVSCSKTGTTWTLTDNGYAASGSGQWAAGTNTSANCATKVISSQALNQLTTFTSGLAGDKVSTIGVMVTSTPPVDVTPDPFTFVDRTEQDTTSVVTSNTIVVAGTEAASAISVTGSGEFSINGGAYTTTPTTVDSGDRVTLRVTTSANGGADTSTTLTIDSVSDEWNVVTSLTGLLTNTIDNYTAQTGLLTFVHALGNSSGAAYKEDTAQVAVIRNGAAVLYLYELGAYGTITKTITLSFAGLSDCEGICDMGNGEFAISAEDAGRYSIHIFDWPVGTTATAKQNLTIFAPGTDNNSGLEDLCYDRVNEVFYAVGEGEQSLTDRRFFRVVRPSNTTTDYTYVTDAEMQSPNVTQPFVAETAFASLGATGALWDLAGMDFDHTSGNVVIASHTGGEIAQVDVTDGSIIGTVAVPLLTQMEGVAILPANELMAMGEAYEYQIFETIPIPSFSYSGDLNTTEIKVAYFKDGLSVTEGALPELEANFYKQELSVSTGTLPELKAAYFKSISGVSTGSLPELELAYYHSEAGVTSTVLQDAALAFYKIKAGV